MDYSVVKFIFVSWQSVSGLLDLCHASAWYCSASRIGAL